jgi:hypothetical protein
MSFGGWWLLSGDGDVEVADSLASTEPQPVVAPTIARFAAVSPLDEPATPETAPDSAIAKSSIKVTAIVDPGTVDFAELSGGPLLADVQRPTAKSDTESVPADSLKSAAEGASQAPTRRDPFVEYLRGRNDSADSDTPKVEPKPPPAVPPSPPKDPPTTADERVRRAQFTTGMRSREPVDELGNDFRIWPVEPERLYFFTELRGLAGNSITHKWLRDGALVATVNFEVGGPRWRVYSSKLITGSMTGQWSVRVEDGAGNLLRSGDFRVTPD